jgi:hypothetical protein
MEATEALRMPGVVSDPHDIARWLERRLCIRLQNGAFLGLTSRFDRA